jgi:hypothetical protein
MIAEQKETHVCDSMDLPLYGCEELVLHRLTDSGEDKNGDHLYLAWGINGILYRLLVCKHNPSHSAKRDFTGYGTKQGLDSPCHLAGAHFETYKLKASFPTSSKSNWFKHWETFESVYLHLGICFNEVYHLWDLLFLLRGEMKRTPNGEIRQMGGGPTRSSLMDTEFKNARKLGALIAFRSLKNELSARRNNITHYARGSTLVIENRPYVPMRVRSNIPWQRELRTKKWWETSLKAAQDLKRTEDVINATHSVLIAGLDLHFSNKGIAIQR